MMLGKKTNDLNRALERADQMDQATARWEADLKEKRAALAEAEGSVGSEALADESRAGKLAEDLVVLRARVDVAESTHGRAVAEAVEARRAALRAYGAELLAEAGRLRAEAETRQKRTDKLLADLKDYEGVEYAPKEIAPQSGIGLSLSPTTRTGALRGKAGQLERQADQWQRRADEAPDSLAQWVQRLLAKLAESAPAAA